MSLSHCFPFLIIQAPPAPSKQKHEVMATFGMLYCKLCGCMSCPCLGARNNLRVIESLANGSKRHNWLKSGNFWQKWQEWDPATGKMVATIIEIETGDSTQVPQAGNDCETAIRVPHLHICPSLTCTPVQFRHLLHRRYHRRPTAMGTNRWWSILDGDGA